MPTTASHHQALTPAQISVLEDQGCSAADWNNVQVSPDFNPKALRNVRFDGKIKLGAFCGFLERDGIARPTGIYNAHLIDCIVEDDARIANIGVHIASYHIQASACIEDVGLMQTRAGATFGNGFEVEALNEGGGREIILFNELSSQFAHLLCLHRFRPKFIAKLESFARTEADKVKSDQGVVGQGATIRNVGEIIDVQVGEKACIHGAASLVDGSILSAADAPTVIGSQVQAEHFIIAEGTTVAGGAIVAKSYVGQGCQVGKQFSAEGSVFFANCEAFHGEACSIFAGPYTVTHHKSTLLIAAQFSFYNAGSGTNQSNHMYKLGPLHEGKLERGVKTGSFSYMMWPCRVGPFSVVLGKHTRNFDTSEFPFAYIEASDGGRCSMIPGLNLSVVGTVRDGAKWPTRDRRKGAVKRDRISFDVLSPLTVGRMIRASVKLKALQDNTPKSVDTVTINGAEVRRVILRSGQKFYRSGIHMYLLEKVIARIEQGQAAGQSIADALAPSSDATYSDEWVDIGGQMMPQARIEALHNAVENGHIADIDALNTELDRIHDAYAEDEWAWVRKAYEQVFEQSLDAVSQGGLVEIADSLLAVRTKFLKLILADAEKEFDQVTRMGFGHGGSAADVDTDFEQVRGTFDDNKFVKQMRAEIEALGERIDKIRRSVGAAV